MNDKTPPRKGLRLEIPSNLQNTYANAAVASHTHSEIIMDFLQIMPNDPRARVQTRLIMTPTNAKLFLKALEQNISRFEEKHGEISVPPKPVTLADQLFSNIKSEDDDDDDSEES